MPNYVTNIVTFTGNQDEINDLLDRIKNDEAGIGTIDFNKITPLPEELCIEAGSKTDRGLKLVSEAIAQKMRRTRNKNPDNECIEKWLKEHEPRVKKEDLEDWKFGVLAQRNIMRFGFPTWYEWCISNWGTKWNSCGIEQGRLAENKIVFQTAWNAPYPIMKKISEMYPNIEISHDWADEDFGQNCGNAEYKNGEVTINCPKTQKEAYEFAANFFNTDLDDMCLRINATGNNYVWCDFENYELVSLLNKPALFSEKRMGLDDIPKGFNIYQLQIEYDEETEEVSYTIVPNFNDDFDGCIITDEPLDFNGQDYINLAANDFIRVYEPDYVSFDDLVSENFDFEQFDIDEGMGGMC